MDKWMPIVGWEAVYEISDKGQIKRIIGGRGTRSGKLLRPIMMPNGYACVRLRYNKKTLRTFIHSLVLSAFIGQRPLKYEINHKDGVRSNNHLNNLEYCTSSENKFHAYRILKRAVVSCKGISNGRAKLSESDVVNIRLLYKSGKYSQQSLAEQFGVSQILISLVVRRKAWPHIPDQ
jgi:hypothetical protein